MLKDTERALVARYALRILERGDLPVRSTRHLLGFLSDRADSLQLPMPKALGKTIGNIYSSKFRADAFERAWNEHRDKYLKTLTEATTASPRPETLEHNLRLLTAALKLPNEALRLVKVVTFYSRFEAFEYFCDAVLEIARSMTRAFSLLAGVPTRKVEQLVAPLGQLVTTGLVQVRPDYDQLAGGSGRYVMPWRIDNVLDQHFDHYEELRQALLGEALTTELELSDYDHVARDRDLMIGMVKGATHEGASGVNVLLYGPPGSGKTEITKLAAAEAGLQLYSTGEKTAGTEEESVRSERLADLAFALRLLSGSKNAAVLFDEMEDVAWQLMKRGGSKIYLNRILEKNPVPVFWTSNNISEIDPAVLRRMTLATELRQPPPKQRAVILKRLARRNKVKLSDEDANELARQIDTTPAVMRNALRAARFSGGGKQAVERAAKGIVRAISGAALPKRSTTPKFDLALTDTKPPLAGLTDSLAASGSLSFSLLLSGPPGTGKSAYARHLARVLGLEVIHKRASDLLGAFVGESEARIAAAFEQAIEAKSLLIFDEAESFLFDRRDATRSWEITQVNEMLTWMEDHPLPVCCTTNLMDRFDRASLRRFTFNVRFNFLSGKALAHAYRVFFDMRTVPAEGMALKNLTPGDFAQARRQAEVLGILQKPAEIIARLTELSRAKPDSFGQIGFVGNR